LPPQACLNAPEPSTGENDINGDAGVESPEDPAAPRQPNMHPAAIPAQNYGMTPEQAMQYNNYLQNAQAQQAGPYGIPPGGRP